MTEDERTAARIEEADHAEQIAYAGLQVPDEPSQEAIERIIDAAPDLRPELIRRLLNVKDCIEAALKDERVNEVGLAWLRTAHAKITGRDE